MPEVRCAVIGHPIKHSLSPRIHQAFARQVGIALAYDAIDPGPDGLGHALHAFAATGGHGCNITLPFKQAVIAHCASLSEQARRIGAANTLTRRGHDWHGDSTDGPGLLADLGDRHGLDLRARRTLLLGAGGAAASVAFDLLDAGIGELTIVNRTPAHADALADRLGQPGRVRTRYPADLADLGEFDLIVNATSAARSGHTLALPTSLAGPRSAAVDLNYGAAAIGFLAWARATGCRDVVDGLGMLVEQAALAFAAWHGQRPDTTPVYAQLRAERPIEAAAD
jgi:shikimate dehydrogenase